MSRPQHRGDGMHATHEVAADLGVGYRRLHRLVQAGHLTPTVRPTGSGSSTRWSDDDVAEARRILARIDWGMTPEAAARTTDPPLLDLPHGVMVDAQGRRYALGSQVPWGWATHRAGQGWTTARDLAPGCLYECRPSPNDEVA